MIDIRITDEFRITSDTMNYILQRLHIPKTGKEKGKEKWIAEGYFGTIEGALDKFKDVKLKESEAKSMEELRKELKEIKKILTDVLGANNG